MKTWEPEGQQHNDDEFPELQNVTVPQFASKYGP